MRTGVTAGCGLKEIVSLTMFRDRDHWLTEAGPPKINGLAEKQLMRITKGISFLQWGHAI